MNWSQLFTSSIGKKIVMSVTGLFLVSFLVVHVGVNSCVFKDAFMSNDNGDMFNRAANFMGKTVVIRLMEYVLFAGIIIHVIQGLALEFENRSKRKQGYEVKMGNRGSKWYNVVFQARFYLKYSIILMQINIIMVQRSPKKQPLISRESIATR